MRKHYPEIIRSADLGWEHLRSRISVDEANRYCGGLDNMQYLIEPGTFSAITHHGCMVYACKDSRYYHDASILPVVARTCDMILTTTHPDGTFDYLATNFYSPAMFEVISFCRGYEAFVAAMQNRPEELALREKMEQVIAHLANGCINGGFHTPNHRWVLCGALLMCHRVLGWPALLDKVRSYLSEGIDCDEYGDFTERSASVYNPINVSSMLIMSEYGHMPELEAYAMKNLDLTFYYLDGDGTIFTRNSRRQDSNDRLSKVYPWHSWYYLYLWAGLKFGNRRYLKLADTLFDQGLRSGTGAPGGLWLYLHFPELQTLEVDLTDIDLPTSYHQFYPNNNIVRCRKEDCSYTLLGSNPAFLHIKFGEKQLMARMCSSFFAVAQFAPAQIERTDTGYRMRFQAHGEYKGLLPEPPASSDWFNMNHGSRPVIHSCELTYTLDIADLPNGLRLDIHVDDTPNVPFKLEFLLPPDTRLETEQVIFDTVAGGSIAVKQGNLRLEDTRTGCEVTIKGLFAEHLYHRSMRGSLPAPQDAFCVYATDFSPVHRTVEILFSKRSHARAMHTDI